MPKTIVLPRSAESGLLWSFHVILDQVPEGAAARAPFVRKVLQKLGVARGRPQGELEKRILERLPLDLDEVDMDALLAIFEDEVPIEWNEDRAVLGADVAAAIEAVVRAILAATDKTTVPRQVIDRMLPELQRLLGPALAEADVPALRQALDDTLVHQLWQSRDPESQEELTEALLEDVESAGRITFAEGTSAG